MRTTVNIDDSLYHQAIELVGSKGKTTLIRDALLALIERESALRLARLGGTEPKVEAVSRRQSTQRV